MIESISFGSCKAIYTPSPLHPAPNLQKNKEKHQRFGQKLTVSSEKKES